jgi:predicted ATP-binding protein involved in virulence
MKLKKVKWENHPVLGDLELDFTNYSSGIPFDTVSLAGENGAGKTSILESISTFLNIGSFEFFNFLEYDVDGQVYVATQQKDNLNWKQVFDITNPDSTTTKIRSDRNNNRQTIENNKLDVRHYGCVFSKATADYKTTQITSTTTRTTDEDKYDVDNQDDFTSLKQLIVDVENQDNGEYSQINKRLGNTPMTWDNYFKTSKIYRFKNAFDTFFDRLKYDKVLDSKSEKSILFTKNGKSISIDQLSTGEKQIVFRGTYLLKNSNNLQGASIMIDEPELSMHPKWQKKILKYYKDLFTESGKQMTQLFLASHSEHVLENALENRNDNLVIVLNDIGGIISAKRIDTPFVLPSITAAETNYR